MSPLSAHDIFTTEWRWNMTSPSSIFLFWIYLFIYHILHFISFFLPPTLLMWMFSCLSLSHLLEFCPSLTVSLQSRTTKLPLYTNYLHQPYWLAPRFWELIIAHTLPYINSLLWQPALLLDSWHLKMRPIGRTETPLRNCHYSPRNNPEERSSHPPEEVRENRFLCTYSSAGWKTLR